MRTLRKHWSGMILTALAGSVATAGIVLFIPPHYRAETLLLVETQKLSEKLVSSTVSSDLQDRLATLSQQILSNDRLEQVVKEFNLYRGDREKWSKEELMERLHKDIAIKLERGWTNNQPGAFRVSMVGENPVTTAAVVNKLGEYFVEENLKSREGQASGASAFLKGQLEDAKRSLTELETKVASYKSQHHIELPEQQQSLVTEMAALQVQLQGNQDAVLRAQQQKASIESSLASSEAILTSLQGVSPARVRSAGATAGPEQISDLDKARRALVELRGRLTDEHPDVKTMRQTIARLEEAERERKAATPAPSPTGTREQVVSEAPPEVLQSIIRERGRITTLKSDLSNVVHELSVREANRQRMVTELASYQRRVERLPLREQEMAALNRDYEISKSNYDSLLKKSLEAGMASDMEKRMKVEVFKILNRASVPEKAMGRHRLILMAAGVFASCLLGLGFAFMMEMKANVILGEWELPAYAPILGRVPIIDSAHPSDRGRAGAG